MAKITLEEQPDFVTLPPDSILHLKVEEATIKDVDGKNGSWQKLEFKFKVLGIQVIGDGSSPDNYESMITQHIWGSVPFKLTDSAENKLRLWSEAILQMELGLGFELDTELFLRREVRGVTTTYEKRATDPKTGQKFKAHQIESLLPKGGHNNPLAAPAAVRPPQAQDPWSTAAQPAPLPLPVSAGAPTASWDEPPF